MSDPDDSAHPSPDGSEGSDAPITPDPDAPGSYVDDEDAPNIPEPNEPA